MSWSISVSGMKADVLRKVATEYVPVSIKAHIFEALTHYADIEFVSVSGSGHLFTGQDFDQTSVNLKVVRLTKSVAS